MCRSEEMRRNEEMRSEVRRIKKDLLEAAHSEEPLGGLRVAEGDEEEEGGQGEADHHLGEGRKRRRRRRGGGNEV